MTMLSTMSHRQRMSLGGAALLALGAAGGAGAVSLTRPTVDMAPTLPTTVSHLPTTSGIVTVRGRVAAIYGDRFLVQDRTGNALVDAGRRGAAGMSTGSAIMVQGRYDNGQLRARFLVDQAGTIEEVGPGPRHDHGVPPPPPPGGPGAPPPPPGGPGSPPPPPPPGAMPQTGPATPPPAPAAPPGTAPLPTKR